MNPSRQPSGISANLRRMGLLLLGWVSLVLGLIGIFVPLLPTTPFVLLAAWCFARSSAAAHRWLIQHRQLGPIILQWQRERSVRREVKQRALLLLCASFALTLVLVPFGVQFKLVLVALGLTLGLVLWRLPEPAEGDAEDSLANSLSGSATALDGKDPIQPR